MARKHRRKISNAGKEPQETELAVDDLGDALGVPRAPDEEMRTSNEILEGRDRYRWEQEDTPER